MPIKSTYITVIALLIFGLCLNYLFLVVDSNDIIFAFLGVGIFILGYHYFVYPNEMHAFYKDSSILTHLFYGQSSLVFGTPSRIKLFGVTFMIAGIIVVVGGLLGMIY